MQTFDRLKRVMEKYEDTYPNTVSLEMKSNGHGKILLDTSRGSDVNYTELMSWKDWRDLEKKLWKFETDFLHSDKTFPANPQTIEDCRPNSYYR